MAYQQIATGGLLDINNLVNYESYIAEGQKGRVEFDLRFSPPEFAVNEIRSQLQKYDSSVVVTANSPLLSIEFTKGFAWLALILALVITAAIMIIGWRIFKDVAPQVIDFMQKPAGVLMLVVAGVVGVVLLSAAIKRRRG